MAAMRHGSKYGSRPKMPSSENTVGNLSAGLHSKPPISGAIIVPKDHATDIYENPFPVMANKTSYKQCFCRSSYERTSIRVVSYLSEKRLHDANIAIEEAADKSAYYCLRVNCGCTEDHHAHGSAKCSRNDCELSPIPITYNSP